MALNSIISIWSSKESSCSISSSFSLSLCLSLSFLRKAVKLDIIVIIKHHHHREHHQHHHYLRSAVKMDILLDALLIFSWFFEGLSPSITYMGRWVLQNSDLKQVQVLFSSERFSDIPPFCEKKEAFLQHRLNLLIFQFCKGRPTTEKSC